MSYTNFSNVDVGNALVNKFARLTAERICLTLTCWLCHNGFPLDLDNHKNRNGVATDLFCTDVIGHPGSMFLH